MPGAYPHIPLQAKELLDFNVSSVLCLAVLFIVGFSLMMLGEYAAGIRKRRWLFRLSFLVVYSILCASTLYVFSQRQERFRRERWAESIACNRDFKAEEFFAERVGEMNGDTALSRLAEAAASGTPFEAARGKSALQGYLQTTYLETPFSRYQYYFTFCEGNEWLLLDNETTLSCAVFFARKALDGTQTPVPGLTAIDYGIEHYAYLYRLALPLGEPAATGTSGADTATAPVAGQFPDTLYVNIELGRKKFADIPGQEGLRLPALYSYAFYSDGDLLSHTGNFLYPYHLVLPPSDSLFFKNWKSCSHLFYPLGNSRFLIVSTPQADPWEILHDFSLFFLLFGWVGSLLLFAVDKNFLGEAGSYAQRLRTGTYLLLLAAFLVFSLMSVWFMQRSYRNENLKVLRNESLSVLGEMESRYWTATAEDFYHAPSSDSLQASFREDINELADLFRTGVYFYSAQGGLLFEQPRPFVPERLDSLMLRDVVEEQQQLTFHSLNQGRKLRAKAAIFPLRNADNEILGYFYMPYFSHQDLWRSEMNRFLGFYLFVMVLLSVVMMTASYWLARRISRPLSLVAEKVSRISLTRKNEHLVWNRKDEIGKLVEQYNVLVDELETSSRKLAESERESAWSEMARQVAHEIKNPLTPLKLQAQQLQRAYRDGKDDFAARLDKFTVLLCEQIDRLAAIAGTFSQFAKWQKPEMQNVAPVDILKKIEAFYAADEHTEFVLQLPPSAEAIRMEADPRFVEQILHNLIKNALQALQEAGTEHPRIVLELKASREKCVLCVSDNGPGIDAGKRAHIFEPHFTTRSTGAGLGLSICRRLAESMHARISLDDAGGPAPEPASASSPGAESPASRGARFCVEFVKITQPGKAN